MSNIHSKSNLIVLITIVMGSLLMGCRQSIAETSYRSYLQDTKNGLTLTRELEETTTICAYRPPDLLVAQELNTAEQVATPVIIDSLRQTYAGKTYIALSLAQQGQEIENQFITNQNALAQAVSYLNNGIVQDVFLAPLSTPTDSMTAYAAIYPRLYGGTGRSTVLLVFDTSRIDLTKGFRVSYRDTQFQLAPVSFTFTAAALSALPVLRF